MNTPTFATLDRMSSADPVEGLGVQHTIEFRDCNGSFIERIHGTREACLRSASERNFSMSAVRITGRAA